MFLSVGQLTGVNIRLIAREKAASQLSSLVENRDKNMSLHLQ